MFTRNPFVINQQYAVGGKAYTCVQLTTYGPKLSGVQKAVLERDNVRYVAVRWPDGEVCRITKE